MEGAMIPKVQVERSIGPVLGFFMPDVMTDLLGKNVVMLSPEFPICKVDNKQSTNIDWLMLDLDKPQLLLVELKTTDTTYRASQADVYEDLQKRIANESGAFLLDDLKRIGESSQEWGKYQNVYMQMCKACNVSDENDLKDVLRKCTSAQVIYIAPKVMPRPKGTKESWKWFNFDELPKVASTEWAYPDEWHILREELLMLDALDRRKRNGDEQAERKNYRELISLDCLRQCYQDKAAEIVVGFINWRSELAVASPEALARRMYKIDDASETAGKIPRNWVRGDQFLAEIAAKNIPQQDVKCDKHQRPEL